MVFENVKTEADKKGMSLNALEKAAGLSKGTIAKWRTASPTIKSLMSVASVLKVNLEDLTKGESGERND
ncbi:helix-turn-helix domain-containing protein [Lachnoclostridium sp. An196]|uniref:helix-turn-helix domain-containing protein n=1 Tax=Lachnoclostridium sp. An196 TaxID=1965583 RepID=UPI0013A63AEA|nr:helix-turn-helix transcriptional regulator [Lachnoclostridium sp. An196]